METERTGFWDIKDKVEVSLPVVAGKSSAAAALAYRQLPFAEQQRIGRLIKTTHKLEAIIEHGMAKGYTT